MNFSGIVDRQARGTRQFRFPASLTRCQGCRNNQFTAIARLALKPYQGGEIRRAAPVCAVIDIHLKLGKRENNASDSAFDHQDIDLGGAALFLVAQGQSVRTRLAHRCRESGLDRPGNRRDLPADISRRVAMARDQRGMRRAARDQAGHALQSDRDLLQSDAAVLDRRRRGAAVAGCPGRRRLARGDLLHLRRSRHRPDCACDHHRREPAVELQPDNRPAWPLRAAAGRSRRARRRIGISGAWHAALAVAEALVGNASCLCLLGDREPRHFQPRPRTEGCGALGAGPRSHRGHRLVRGAIDFSPGDVWPGLSTRAAGDLDHDAADLDCRLGRARGHHGACLRICRIDDQ